ncbi:reverse transcriptase domain-containing protein [Tanacetum coccineum]
MPAPDLCTMEELCQPTMNGRGGLIAPVNIQATDFGLKNHMIQQVHNSCQFHGLPGDDANKHLDKFLIITQSMKQNGVTDDALRLNLFPYSLTHHATAWFDRLSENSINTFQEIASKFLSKYFPPSIVTKLRNDISNFRQLPDESLFKAWERYKLLIDRCPNHNMLPVTQIDTFYNGLILRHRDTINVAAGGTFMKRRPKECYDFIENMTAHHNDWDTSAHRGEASSSITSSSSEIVALTQQMAEMRKDMLQMYRLNQQVNYVSPSSETCGGPHPYYKCQAAGGYTQDVYATSGTYNQGGNTYQPQGQHANQAPNQSSTDDLLRQLLIQNQNLKRDQEATNQLVQTQIGQLTKALQERPQGVLPSNTVPNPREDLKAITTRSGVTLAGPSVPPPPLSSSEEVEREPETTTDQVLTESTTSVPPPVVQPSPASTSSELPPAPISSPVIPEPNPHQPPIPYPSRLNKEKLQDKADIQIHSFLQMFKKIYFNISFAEALAHMPKFAKMVKDLLTNKEKLIEMANTPLNENCSAVLLKKLPEKLGDTRRFLIPCDFYGFESCMALADLGASINLMPLSVWKKLSLPELSPTRMTLELATRTVAYPAGIAEDVFVQVGKFTFPADFVVVDYDVDPRVPLILGRPFLRTAHALVDVHGEELTLRVGDEKLVFNVESTSKYPRKHGDESIHKIDILDITCEDHFHEVLNVQKSINPMRIGTFLASDDSTSPDDDDETFDMEGDIRLIETLLNNDILNDLPPPLPVCVISEIEKIKSSIDDPPDLELKDLPPHLEYAFLEGTSKLPVIIAKDLKREEKEQLLKVLTSHKRAIAWKISDIQGIDPNFCTHKILMEDDFKPAVQHQRRVNPKIHEVIKEEVIKLLDARLIYPISDSPWVSPIHVVPKKGGMTVITNENNDLIPTRLVTGWRVCIDYRKLNDATRKDHFPLPFMDQMLERLARNEYYCFLNGFSRYFQIPIDPQDQEKTTFTCPYGTFAYRRMPFGLCNAPGTFQRCMVAIFHDMIEKTMEVFMDDFSVFGDSFSSCLSYLDMMLKWCKDTNLVLNWEKCHFMVKEGIVLGHKIYKYGIEVDKAKVDVIAKLPPPTTKLTEAPILVSPDWDLPFELMCDASDFAIGAVIKLLAVVYAFEKFRSYLVLSKTIVYTDHSTLKYLFAKQDAKPRLLWWILLLQEFNIEIRDKKGAENLAADHLSRLENPQGDRVGMEINDIFPQETLDMISLNPDNEPPWFADISNYLVGNMLIKGMSSQQKKKFFKDVRHYFWDAPISLGFVLIRLFGCVWTGRKLWTFSKLVTMVPLGDIMARTTPPRKFSTSVSSGLPFIARPMTLSHTVTHVSVREKISQRDEMP